VQFTPDLLPADLTGTEIWRPQEGRFEFVPGPIFHPILLADEINRAPAKVQSALLEAMGERQVTVGRHTYALPPLFLVMATQNPIEQEGTFPLPEAQLDRFLMHVRIGYPTRRPNRRSCGWPASAPVALGEAAPAPEKMPMQDVFDARREVLDLHMAPALERYLIELVLASRDPSRYDAGLAAASPGAQARAVPSHWNAAPVRAPGWPAATSSPPTTCGRRRRAAPSRAAQL
jgi:MoxR-like ATPase